VEPRLNNRPHLRTQYCDAAGRCCWRAVYVLWSLCVRTLDSSSVVSLPSSVATVSAPQTTEQPAPPTAEPRRRSRLAYFSTLWPGRICAETRTAPRTCPDVVGTAWQRSVWDQPHWRRL